MQYRGVPTPDIYSLTLYQPMTHICIMSSYKPIRIYMGGLILGGKSA